MSDPLARFTRPGRSIPSSTRKDVHLPGPKRPSVRDAFRKAGEGLQILRDRGLVQSPWGKGKR